MVRPKCCRVRRWAAWAMSSRNGAAAGDSKAARSSGCRSSRPKARLTSPAPARSTTSRSRASGQASKILAKGEFIDAVFIE